jgi:hypothetical protein
MTTKEEQLTITKYDLLFESRLSKVETSLDHLDKNMSEIKIQIKSDFRWLFSLIVLLGAMMAKGFHWY